MKKRFGFVSNSSTSSFVIIGARIPRDELYNMGWFDEDDCTTDKAPEGISFYYDEIKYIVGIPVAKSCDWGFENVEIDATEIQEMINKVSDSLVKDMPANLKFKVKLLIGTRLS